ncbi:hypothetical protein GH714_015845 [Hevea brasiliensis]|uniref:AMP-activated protein kinase glycogen-binding domain-containing protein n=1 Tax=Hevea brasiliensis TaxID=3981 RepID=A0A6A6L9Q3_HEVBR|nr:hypothetical protein GH714_015845 [Hevea brasiliensis]
MGNVNGREDGENRADGNGSNGESSIRAAYSHRTVVSSDSMANVNNNNTNNYSNATPPHSPARSASPLSFASQVPVAPLHRPDGPPFLNQMWQNESSRVVDHPPQQGIPTIITWNYGGNEVFLEGSWDNWMSRKQLQRSGKDHSILLVLPSGIYHYKFIVDGEWRYIPDLPFVADEMGRVCNLLDVNYPLYKLFLIYTRKLLIYINLDPIIKLAMVPCDP